MGLTSLPPADTDVMSQGTAQEPFGGSEVFLPLVPPHYRNGLLQHCGHKAPTTCDARWQCSAVPINKLNSTGFSSGCPPACDFRSKTAASVEEGREVWLFSSSARSPEMAGTQSRVHECAHMRK